MIFGAVHSCCIPWREISSPHLDLRIFTQRAKNSRFSIVLPHFGKPGILFYCFVKVRSLSPVKRAASIMGTNTAARVPKRFTAHRTDGP